MPKTATLDPWLLDQDGNPDPFSANIDFKPIDDELTDDSPPLAPNQGIEPEVVSNVPAPSDPTPTPELESEGPEVFEVDGGQVSLEKERGQWKAALTNEAGGNPQIYWGKNKNELLANVLKAQLNATKKIRELNRKLKVQPPAESPVPPQPRPTLKPLSADDIIDIKTKLESNPDLALNEWFQKATGLSVQQLVNLAQQGSRAALELQAEAVNKDFLQRNPDYYSDPDYANFANLIKWMAKYKLGKAATDDNADQIFQELLATGNYTVSNLEAAFEDLSDEGKMIKAPRPPKTTTPVTDSHPAPAPRPDERIVRTETRPRAATGIRSSEVTPIAPAPEPKAPSAEELDSLNDEQIRQLMQGVRRTRMQARRSN